MEYIIQLITIILVAYIALQVRSLRTLPRSDGSKRTFVDTSALMDGRIITAARTGFIPSSLDIPKSVIAELQLLADQADAEKRSRARGGLDVVKQLQELESVTVTIYDDGPMARGGVDERLVELAKRFKGQICTIDFNLNKVASIEGIFVLNINELAQHVRMAYLPGEKISLNLVQKGQDSHQAVGYLADGTMVVVEQAVKLIGSSAEIEFIRSLQTAAGRMMFAKLVHKNETEPKQQNNGRKRVRTTKSQQKESDLLDLVNQQ